MTLVHNGITLRGTVAQGWALNGRCGCNVSSKAVMQPVGNRLTVSAEDLLQTDAASVSFSVTTYVSDSDAWYSLCADLVGDVAAYVGKVGALQVVDTSTYTIADCAMLTDISASSADHVPAKAYAINYSFTIVKKGSGNMTLIGPFLNGGFESVDGSGSATRWNTLLGEGIAAQRYGTEPIGSGDVILQLAFDGEDNAGIVISDTQLYVEGQTATNKFIRYSWDAALQNLLTTQLLGSYKVDIKNQAGTPKATRIFSVVSSIPYRHSITLYMDGVYESSAPTHGIFLQFMTVTPSDQGVSKIFIDNVTCEELNAGEEL